MIKQAIAACLAAALVTSCVTTDTARPGQRRPGELEAELSREIERMLRHQRQLEAERNRRDSIEKRWQATALQSGLQMPVVGVSPVELRSSFGDARSGGRRHAGIDIFAPRGTAVVAVSHGYVSFIGTRALAGRCLWLTTDDGGSYFYAHLDGWAPGLWEGQEVASGALLGFVGSSGNASGSSSHLHFEVHQDGVALDPYPILSTRALSAESELSR